MSTNNRLILELVNGQRAFDFSPHRESLMEMDLIKGRLYMSGVSDLFTFLLWDFEGRCIFIKNCDLRDLSEFDLVGLESEVLNKILN
jgi:hypothetical protein